MTTPVLDAARALFARSNLGFPPVPASLAPHIRNTSEWVYSTLAKPRPYVFFRNSEDAEDPRTEDSFTVGHAGHGSNSYSITFFLVYRRVRILLQYGWGGVYMDNERAAAKIATAFAHLTAAWPAIETRFATRDELHVFADSDFYSGFEVQGTATVATGSKNLDLAAACARLAGTDESHLRIPRPTLAAPAGEWLAYGDVLQEAGDPRGELVTLAHAVTEGRADRVLRDAYIARHAVALLGPAATHLPRYELALEYCEIVEATIRLDAGDDPVKIVHDLLAAPAARHLRRLRVDGAAGRLDNDRELASRRRRGMLVTLQ